ncbi:MAG: hypothetical protein RL499_954, partial [Actinomycetota bacterium]
MATGAAPGWYADAANPALIRWWDGSAWSEHTQPNPSAPSAPAVSAPVVSAPVSSVPVASAPVAATGALPLPSAPYVPPPFADPAASQASPVVPASQASPPVPASQASAPVPASQASPAVPAPARPTSASISSAPYSPGIGSASTPGSRKPSAKYVPVSEPVRLVPPTAGSAAVAGFPGFDEPMSASPAGQSPVSAGAQPSAPAPTGTPWAAAAPFAAAASFAQPRTASVDLASVDYEPMTRTWGSQRTSGAARVASGASTGGSWVLALSPLILLGFAVLGWWLTDGATTSTTPYVFGGLGSAGLLVMVVGALSDYRRLGALGHEHRASVAWLLAGPFFYLLVRAIHVHRTMRTGTAPTVVYVVLVVAVGVAAAALSLFLPRDAGVSELRAV